jgi:hypothetical protein
MANWNPARALASGAAGALSLNVMHECTRLTVPNAPRVDIIGMRAVAGLARAAGRTPPEHLRATTLAADVAANTLYYSVVAAKGPEYALALGSVLGVAAGLGAVLLPPPMGLGSAEINRTRATQVMTAGMYAMAGLVAGAVYSALARRT